MATDSICRGGSGHFLPLFSDAEQRLPDGLRAALYMAGLLYAFLGVSIAAEIFMVGIERITSQTRKVKDASGRTKSVRVWNETVANLTLMALGSSAPEILLNVIEVTGGGFYSGELGPSSVVGSAAFNLLIVLGVCMLAVPEGEIRRVKDFKAAALLAGFSVFAYLWLVLVVSLNTMDVIDVWEGVATFLFFPLLVVVAWAVDTGKLCGPKEGQDSELPVPSTMATPVSEIARERSGQSTVIVQQQPTGNTVQPEVSVFSNQRVVGETWTARDRALTWSHARSDATRAITGSRVRSKKTTPPKSTTPASPAGSAVDSTHVEEAETLTYREQVCEALFCNGSLEEQREAGWAEFVLHLVALPWKLPLAALTPPANLAGGWICFVGALVHIGIITTLIGDLAELVGCVMGLENSITALTLVAMGTSMPELFASKSATVKNSWADASITNITGSNSINVFLGMGLPWMVASIYWKFQGATAEWLSTYSDYQDILSQYPDGAFVVIHGDLSFSVTVFVVAACICFSLLAVRRWKFGGELGGPSYEARVLSAALLFTLWTLYITVSVWEIQTNNQDVVQQSIAVLMAGAVLVVVMSLTWVALKIASYVRREPRDGTEAGSSKGRSDPDVVLEEGPSADGKEMTI